MKKRPLLIAGGLALMTVAAATAAQAQEQSGQGQGGWMPTPNTSYYPMAATNPASLPGEDRQVQVGEVAQAPGDVPEVVVYAGQGWQAEPAVPVYSPADVDHEPQTGRGGLENNNPDSPD